MPLQQSLYPVLSHLLQFSLTSRQLWLILFALKWKCLRHIFLLKVIWSTSVGFFKRLNKISKKRVDEYFSTQNATSVQFHFFLLLFFFYVDPPTEFDFLCRLSAFFVGAVVLSPISESFSLFLFLFQSVSLSMSTMFSYSTLPFSLW